MRFLKLFFVLAVVCSSNCKAGSVNTTAEDNATTKGENAFNRLSVYLKAYGDMENSPVIDFYKSALNIPGIAAPKYRLQDGHFSYQVEFCEAGSIFICSQSEYLEFSIPKDQEILAHGSWEHQGLEYAVVREYRVQKDYLYVINITGRSTSESTKQFIWSQSRGVVSYQERDGDVYLLSLHCGLGAPKECRHRN